MRPLVHVCARAHALAQVAVLNKKSRNFRELFLHFSVKEHFLLTGAAPVLLARLIETSDVPTDTSDSEGVLKEPP